VLRTWSPSSAARCSPVFGIVAAAAILVAQYLAWRSMRRGLTPTQEPPVPVSVEPLPDFDYGDSILFRVSVRNTGDRIGVFRARIAKIDGLDPRGPEAPFELAWRHGNNKWAVTISHDDDEVWLNVGLMPKFPPEQLRQIERERWAPAVFFDILVNEDQPPQQLGAAIVGIETADDLTSYAAWARLTIRHGASGSIVADKMITYSYREDDHGVFVPHTEIADS
jgi:hypothetical protein